MKNLNEIELAIYKECCQLAKLDGDNGYEFVFEFLVDKTKLKLSKKQFKGYISQLVQKGYLITFNDKKNPSYFTHGVIELIPKHSLKYYNL